MLQLHHMLQVDNVAWKEANDDLDAGIKTAPLAKRWMDSKWTP